LNSDDSILNCPDLYFPLQDIVKLSPDLIIHFTSYNYTTSQHE